MNVLNLGNFPFDVIMRVIISGFWSDVIQTFLCCDFLDFELLSNLFLCLIVGVMDWVKIVPESKLHAIMFVWFSVDVMDWVSSVHESELHGDYS
jgi:hypothetical protein